jgi:hypothetical protein
MEGRKLRKEGKTQRKEGRKEGRKGGQKQRKEGRKERNRGRKDGNRSRERKEGRKETEEGRKDRNRGRKEGRTETEGGRREETCPVKACDGGSGAEAAVCFSIHFRSNFATSPRMSCIGWANRMGMASCMLKAEPADDELEPSPFSETRAFDWVYVWYKTLKQ